MLSRRVLCLAALLAAGTANSASANYLLTPFGGYVGSFNAYSPGIGYGHNPYYLAGGYGVGAPFAYNNWAGPYGYGYVPSFAHSRFGYYGGSYGGILPYSPFGYTAPSRYYGFSAYGYGFAPYSNYLPFTGYYGSALNAYGAGFDGSNGYLAYDPGPSVGYYRGPSSYVSNEPPTKAIVDVEVPEGAKVWFGGVETKQTGTKRSFISPSLTGMNQYYKYEIKAVWTEDGKPVERTQTVYVKPGERSNVMFLKGAMAAAR